MTNAYKDQNECSETRYSVSDLDRIYSSSIHNWPIEQVISSIQDIDFMNKITMHILTFFYKNSSINES
jgi:hypothetical protein